MCLDRVMSVTRRDFITTASALGVGSILEAKDARTGMPMRTLGKTGQSVSILVFGSGSRFLAYKEEDKGLEALTKALDSGITYIDTAYAYGNGQSESWIGKIMPARRNTVFLATKVSVRDGDEAWKSIEGSLRRLNTDHVDLLHIHNLQGEDDLANVEKKGNVLDMVRKARDQKMARFIGVTSHTDPAVLKTALERHDFDCTQMALNAAKAGMAKGVSAYGEVHEQSFETMALPVAVRKKMGIIAMKVFAQDQLKAPAKDLMRYSLSLPVTACVVGMPKIEFVEENIAIAKAFQPMNRQDMQRISGELVPTHKAKIDAFFADHVDA